VDDKPGYTQRAFKDGRLPQVWNRRPGRDGWRERALGSYRRSDSILDDYTVHKTDLLKNAMEESNTSLFLILGGLTPKTQPCDGLINKLFKSNMSKLYDDYMASNGVVRNDRGYPDPPSKGVARAVGE
jgi:hypothetical protein